MHLKVLITLFQKMLWFIHSMHLRGIFRCYFTQVWLAFNLDVQGIFCVKLIYFHKNFHLIYNLSKFKIWNVWIWGKVTNLNPKMKNYFLAWHLHRLGWSKLATDLGIYALKNSVEMFMWKSVFFLNKCTETCWSHLNSPNIRHFFHSFRWNKWILT